MGSTHGAPHQVYLGAMLVALWLYWLYILPTCLGARPAAALHRI